MNKVYCPFTGEYAAESEENFQCPFEYILGKERTSEIAQLSLYEQQRAIQTFLPNAPFHCLHPKEKVFEKLSPVASHHRQNVLEFRNVDKYKLFLCRGNHLIVGFDIGQNKIVSLDIPYSRHIVHCMAMIGGSYHVRSSLRPFDGDNT